MKPNRKPVNYAESKAAIVSMTALAGLKAQQAADTHTIREF